ncbi:hypothetical protein SCL_0631 [Sulfuricaulis limicola]|uniref:DUF4340 domain-containing protein n=1 Tax=Sulfuricaulis limicola TaxID=1620215 RepID=A0A1B4XDU2_9GAMM|nr:DUF4340 domain-containing protein [Sulfuricaulis limicola]BAV32953.1 hypothetical protein SCL_0631 [Sulfuricaulis limicola]
MPDIENSGETGQNQAPPAGPSGLRQRWLLNAALLVVIGLLAWLALHRAGQENGVATPPLTTLAAETVSHVSIEQPGHPAIALEKTGAEWRLTGPVQARANPFNVESLLRILAAPGETRFSAGGQDLAKFGLDRPRSHVRYGDAEIAFGSLHPLNNRIYVLHNNEIVLIPAHYLASAVYPYTNFIDSRLFEEQRKLTAIRLPDFTLAQQDGAWHKQPPDKRLTSDRLNEFAAEWQNARALGVEKYSGKEILDRIEVTTIRDDKTEKLALGILAYKPDFVLYRQDENLEYHLTEDAGKRLLSISLQ